MVHNVFNFIYYVNYLLYEMEQKTQIVKRGISDLLFFNFDINCWECGTTKLEKDEFQFNRCEREN